MRELENYLERALILSDGASFSLPALSGPPRSANAKSTRADPSSLDEVIRKAIVDVLKTTSGKVYGADGAAAVLGLKPSTLQAKMKRLGVDVSGYR